MLGFSVQLSFNTLGCFKLAAMMNGRPRLIVCAEYGSRSYVHPTSRQLCREKETAAAAPLSPGENPVASNHLHYHFSQRDFKEARGEQRCRASTFSLQAYINNIAP